MTWSQLNELAPELVTIGSHTMSHPILPVLSDSDLEYEMQESRTTLQRQLRRPIDYFCYPNGDCDARAVELARRTYLAAVTVETACLNTRDLHRLPRVPACDNVPLLFWRLHSPAA